MLKICKEIVVFLILAKVLESFQTGNKYGKFVKLTISLIVVLKLITPIFSLFDREFDWEKMMSEIEQRLVFEETIEEPVEDTMGVEMVQIEETRVYVEEIKWEK